MSSVPSTADLIGRNAEYAIRHEPIASFQERIGAGSQLPSVAVIACADPRCIPGEFLKLKTWDAVVIRTAGSNVKAALPSLIAIDELVKLQEVMVINHTDCGALAFRDDVIRSTLAERAPKMSAQIDTTELGQISGSLEDRVREHVTIARETLLLREELRANITGYIYNLKSGLLQRIK